MSIVAASRRVYWPFCDAMDPLLCEEDYDVAYYDDEKAAEAAALAAGWTKHGVSLYCPKHSPEHPDQPYIEGQRILHGREVMVVQSCERVGRTWRVNAMSEGGYRYSWLHGQAKS